MLRPIALKIFIHGLRGSLHVTFEEGTCAAWLHDLHKPHVTRALVCDPRRNELLKVGNKTCCDSTSLREPTFPAMLKQTWTRLRCA
jgi:hypothetical protein